MKFSLVIPTQDRPALLDLALRHATATRDAQFEIVVSDNSTNDASKALNAEVVARHASRAAINLVRPPRVMGVCEHFEFALPFANGDYVAYLTDKMALLPGTLSRVAVAATRSNADIVNWRYLPYVVQDGRNPSASGTLTVFPDYAEEEFASFDPLSALRFKSSGAVRREFQSMRDYVHGKIVFGCFSADLLRRIRAKSGTVFRGATHDYSAMIQGLALARRCVMLGSYGIVFVALPREQSMGSLTATEPQRALQYFRAMTDGESVLASLPVPGVYASQHNMVGYDYRTFLPQYGYSSYYNETNWLSAIHADLMDPAKVWTSAAEKADQIERFARFVRDSGKGLPLRIKAVRDRVAGVVASLRSRVIQAPGGHVPKPGTYVTATLDEAIGRLAAP